MQLETVASIENVGIIQGIIKLFDLGIHLIIEQDKTV